MSLAADFRRAVELGVSDLIKMAEGHMEIVTRYDEEPAQFRKEGRGLRQSLVTDDEYFVNRNNGTDDFFVAPVNAQALAFREYKAHTTPNEISSEPGGPFGETYFSKGHMVSGIEARNHDEASAVLLRQAAAGVICDRIRQVLG